MAALVFPKDEVVKAQAKQQLYESIVSEENINLNASMLPEAGFDSTFRAKFIRHQQKQLNENSFSSLDMSAVSTNKNGKRPMRANAETASKIKKMIEAESMGSDDEDEHYNEKGVPGNGEGSSSTDPLVVDSDED